MTTHDTIMALAESYADATAVWRHEDVYGTQRNTLEAAKKVTVSRNKLYAALADLIAERDRLLYEVDAIAEIKAERDTLQTECLEQSRLLGISGSREAALLAELGQLQRKHDHMVHVRNLESQNPWRHRAEQLEIERDALIAERDALAKDAARYQFLRMRLKVRKMAAVSGSVRDGIDVKTGYSFLDSKLPHTTPETYPIEQAEKLDAAIDAAMKGTPT